MGGLDTNFDFCLLHVYVCDPLLIFPFSNKEREDHGLIVTNVVPLLTK
jgi:hypothetical protein